MTKTGKIITATLLTIATIGLVVFAVKKGVKPKTLQTQAGLNYVTTTWTGQTLTEIEYSKEATAKIIDNNNQKDYYLTFLYNFNWTYTPNTNTTAITTDITWKNTTFVSADTVIEGVINSGKIYNFTTSGLKIPEKIGMTITWLENYGNYISIGYWNYALYYNGQNLLTLYDEDTTQSGIIQTNVTHLIDNLDIEVFDSPSIRLQAQNAIFSYETGYNNGEQAGITTGYNNGYSAGETAGYTDGHETGYAEGWNNADAFDHPIAIQPLMLNILTMPFTFISQAFDVTLWPGTQYEFNIANFIKGLIAIATILFIIKMFTSGFSIIGNFTKNTEQEMTMRSDNRKSRQAWKSQKIANKSNKMKKEE